MSRSELARPVASSVRVERAAGPSAAVRGLALAALVAAVAVPWGAAVSGDIPRIEVLSIRAERELRQEPNSISGTVLRGPGIGDGAGVTLLSPGTERSTVTDAWGRFAFAGVEPGAVHTLVVESPGCAPLRVAGIVLHPFERRQVLDLHLSEPRPAQVRVTDEYGVPVPGAVVEVFRHPRSEDEVWIERAPDFVPAPIVSQITDADGIAVLDSDPRERATLVARAPGFARAVRARWRETRAWTALTLYPACSLSGTVRDTRGIAVARAIVRARRPPPIRDTYHGRRDWAAALWHRTVTDDAGRWSFDDLPPGEIEVDVARRGTGSLGGALLVLPDTVTTDLVASETLRWEGVVRDTATLAPIPGVPVVTGEPWGNDEGAVVFTGADGRWSVESAWNPDGPCEVPGLAPMPGISRRSVRWTPNRRVPPEFPPQGATQPFEVLVQTATASVAGTIRKSEDEVRFLAIGPGTPGPKYLFDTHINRLACGRFRLDDLAPEPTAVCALPDRALVDGSWDEWNPEDDAWGLRRATVDLVAGSVAVIRLPVFRLGADERDAPDDAPAPPPREGLRIHVRVTTTDRLPLRFAFVRWHGFSLPRRGSDDGIPLPADGRTTIGVDAHAGAFTVELVAWDDRHEESTVQVTLPPPDAVPQEASAEIVLRPRGR